MVYSTKRFVLCLALCYFSIAITSIGEERASLGAFRTFVWFALVWFCLFPPTLGVWEGLRFVIVALPWLFWNLPRMYSSLHRYLSKTLFNPLLPEWTPRTLYIGRVQFQFWGYFRLWDLGIPREEWLHYLQKVETLIRRCILRRLIWVCTVCHLPF